MRRRTVLAVPPALMLAVRARAAALAAPMFPRDHGAHPDFRIEWWYVTGRLLAGERPFGFQVTFFRTRVGATQGMASRFAAKQLVFAHAALTDVEGGRLHHDQRIAREGAGVAYAHTDDTDVRLRDWVLARDAGTGRFVTHVAADGFTLDLACTPTQPVLLQGEHGLSRKGPLATQASDYYSLPHLAVRGSIALQDRRIDVQGQAWMDHEWSDELLAPEAVGWDWIGMNLDDGSALTAFRLRRENGTPLWDGGSFRDAHGRLVVFPQGTTRFTPKRTWTSPASRTRYPVAWDVETPAGRYTVDAVIDAQELDSRGSTGAIYWEGLAALRDAQGRRVGWGYLEMTGYAQRLRL